MNLTGTQKGGVEPSTSYAIRQGVMARRFLVLSLITLVARGLTLGYPDYHVDETFYLMTGDAMRHGALPYVDIWDRKPLGLFLFYEFLATISPTVWSYQIAALGFVTATAMLVAGLARRWSNETGALLAGASYVAWLEPLIGGGGQSPVFYTLFSVGAVFLFVRSALDKVSSTTLANSLFAAVLSGIAVWFKPTAVFEGTFVVLGFGWLQWRKRPEALPIFLRIAAMGFLLVAPTLSGVVWYAMHGHFYALWQATILSNFNKTAAPTFLVYHTIRYLFLLTMLLCSTALLGLNETIKEKSNIEFTRIMIFWAIFGIIGFASVPNFYSHYFITLVPILSIMSAPYFSKKPVGVVIAVFSIFWALSVGQSFSFQNSRLAKAQFERLIVTVSANMPHRTLYIYMGSSWIYHETNARPLTRFVFPEHLESSKESKAIGVDPALELIRILKTQPDVILVEDNIGPDYNKNTFKILTSEIDKNYTIVCTLPVLNFEGKHHYFIFSRSKNPDRSACPVGSPDMLRLLSPKDVGSDFRWQ